jgi:hypothetical protein
MNVLSKVVHTWAMDHSVMQAAHAITLEHVALMKANV